MTDRWLSIAELMTHSGLSRDTLDRAMADPADPLPVTRVYTALRVRLSDFEAWMERRQRVGARPSQSAVRKVLGRINGTGPRRGRSEPNRNEVA